MKEWHQYQNQRKHISRRRRRNKPVERNGEQIVSEMEMQNEEVDDRVEDREEERKLIYQEQDDIHLLYQLHKDRT